MPNNKRITIAFFILAGATAFAQENNKPRVFVGQSDSW